MLYSDEVWTGIEYQVAAHMIYEGMIEEAYAIVKGARDRYDGIPRRADRPQPLERDRVRRPLRPGHVELVAAAGASGLRVRRRRQDVSDFTPRVTPEKFKAFFAGPEGWGSLQHDPRGRQAA